MTIGENPTDTNQAEDEERASSELHDIHEGKKLGDDDDPHAEWDPSSCDAPVFVLCWVPHNGGVGERLHQSCDDICSLCMDSDCHASCP